MVNENNEPDDITPSEAPTLNPAPQVDLETAKLPMEGVRVIDLGTFLAGPYAASILGEFGAEVFKVEHPIAGDPMRRFGTATKRHDATLAWLSEARNRKSVTIDLRQPEGVQLFLRLIEKSDVLIENFRPGTMEEWGLSWQELSEANPGLVYLRVSGYGQTGPYRRRSGFAHIAHAFGGLSYLAGFPGETPVVPGTAPLGDYISSIYGAIGILLALRHRELSGRGQIVDIGIYEAVFRQLDEIAASYGLFGKVREREGSGSFVAVPHGHFRTKDDKWIAIACTTDKMFERLAEAMEQPELASSSLYGPQRQRLAARDEVNRIVIEWVGSLNRAEVLERCLNCEVPVGKVNSIADIFEDEHFQARGNLARINEDGLGEVVVPNVVPTLSATPGRIANLGPTLGNATYEVMRELLGLTADDIKRLRQRRII
ncbi:MAG: CoA transferase [Candidatus Competibacteraceae bacterium]|nr:CoA transferase [Candidatus Competibacteraceae bacterium]